jgi:hypothetical protein
MSFEQIIFDKQRALLATQSLVIGQTFCKKFLRRLARFRVYHYAERYKITDFQDAILVEQVHRDFRQSVIDATQTKVVEVDATITVAELLIVFDSLLPWVE